MNSNNVMMMMITMGMVFGKWEEMVDVEQVVILIIISMMIIMIMMVILD